MVLHPRAVAVAVHPELKFTVQMLDALRALAGHQGQRIEQQSTTDHQISEAEDHLGDRLGLGH